MDWPSKGSPPSILHCRKRNRRGKMPNLRDRLNEFQSWRASVDSVNIHYLKAGTGSKTLVLIHGFGDTSHMWIPLFDDFAKDYTIIAPDMRGLGDSSKPAAGYDKKTL